MRKEKEHIEKLNKIYNSKDFGHYIKFLGRDKINSNKYWYFCEIHKQKFQRYKGVILNGFGCDECKKDKQEVKILNRYFDFIKIFKQRYPNWKIKSWFKGKNEKIKLECEKGHEWEVVAINLIIPNKIYHCPYCIHQKVSIEDSIYNLRPDLIKYFKNPEESKIVSLGSNRKIDMICPDCGYEKKFAPSRLVQRGFGCLMCGDGLSYGEKFLREVNKQIQGLKEIEYEYYCLKNLKLGMKKDNYFFYDCKFVYKGQKFYIEMDGDGHQKDTKPRGFFTKEALEERRKADKEKDKLAKRDNAIIIRINFNGETRKDMEEIFLNSDMAKYFNLSNINWNICREKSESNLVKEVCKYIMKHKTENRKHIADKFNLGLTTVYNYIKVGRKLGWIDDSVPNIRETMNKKVLCYDKEMNFIKEFPSISSACSFLSISQSKADRALYPNSRTYLTPINGYIIKLKDETKARKR